MSTVKPKKLETFLRPNSAGIPCTLLLGIGAIEFPTFWLLSSTIGVEQGHQVLGIRTRGIMFFILSFLSKSFC